MSWGQRLIGNLLAILSLAMPLLFAAAWIVLPMDVWRLLTSDAALAVILCGGVAVTGFWTWMFLIHLRHRTEDGPVWTLGLVLGLQVSAVIYYLQIYPQHVDHRLKQHLE